MVMRMLVEKYTIPAENQFVFMAALRSDSSRVVTSTTWGNWPFDNHYSTFWQ